VKIRGLDDFVVCYGWTDIGPRQRLSQRFDTVKAGMNGAIPVGVQVRIDPSTAECYEDGSQRLSGKIDRGSTARTGHPARIRRRPGVREIRLAHRARERGTRDYSVEEQLCVTNRDAGRACCGAFVVLLRERDYSRYGR